MLFIAGDSLVAGVGSTSVGWAQMLLARSAGEAIGIPGATTNKLLAVLSRHAKAMREASVLIYHVGLNDSRLRPSRGATQTPIDQFAFNLRVLAEIATPDTDVVFVGLPRVYEDLSAPLKPDKHYLNCLVDVFDGVIRDTARIAGACYVKLPAFDDPSMLADGIHPSDIGYNAILQAVLSAFDSNGWRL